jgi:hypothetical protein
MKRWPLVSCIIHKWHTKQIDFVSAYTQALAPRDLYMELPKGFEVEGSTYKKEYVLMVHRNIYG